MKSAKRIQRNLTTAITSIDKVIETMKADITQVSSNPAVIGDLAAMLKQAKLILIMSHLNAGKSQGEVGEMFGLHASRISQLKKEYHKKYG